METTQGVVEIGDWDSPSQTIEIESNMTVAQVLEKAGKQVSASQRVALLNTNEIVNLNDLARDGESYIITQSHVSG